MDDPNNNIKKPNEMLKKYGEIEDNKHISNEDDFVCGYDGKTYYKTADNAKQVCKHYLLQK